MLHAGAHPLDDGIALEFGHDADGSRRRHAPAVRKYRPLREIWRTRPIEVRALLEELPCRSGDEIAGPDQNDFEATARLASRISSSSPGRLAFVLRDFIRTSRRGDASMCIPDLIRIATRSRVGGSEKSLPSCAALRRLEIGVVFDELTGKISSPVESLRGGGCLEGVMQIGECRSFVRFDILFR